MIKRVNLSIPESLLKQVHEYRRKQPDPMPNQNQALIQLIEKGLKQK